MEICIMMVPKSSGFIRTEQTFEASLEMYYTTTPEAGIAPIGRRRLFYFDQRSITRILREAHNDVDLKFARHL